MNFAHLLLMCLLQSVAQVEIIAPETAQLNYFTLVSVREQPAKDSKSGKQTFVWQVPDKHVSVFTGADGRQIVLYSKEAKYVKVRLTVTDGAGNKSSDAVVIEFGASPPGPPGPGPNPPLPAPCPTPTPNPNSPSVAETIARESAKLVNCPAEHKLIISVLNSIKSDLTNPDFDLTDTLSISRVLTKRFTSLPADVQKRWLVDFAKPWTTEIDKELNAQSLQTPQQWTLFIDQTVKGLE